jgi:transglutaminase-like putative cysteine protease
MSRYAILHRTLYRYARLVELGPHRLLVRPTDSHDLRLESATIMLSPKATVRWSHDVFSNSIATAVFERATNELLIESRLEVSRFSRDDAAIEVEESARTYPFVYAPDDRLNLGPFLDCRYAHCAPAVIAWAQDIVHPGSDTLQALRDMNAAVRNGFAYMARTTSGVQTPSDTLATRSGTCRDFATLFIEAARALGFGARFVTGYLYDPALDIGSSSGIAGAGATHAWAEVYLPGPGWVEFDPTNGLIESPGLLRVGVATDAEHAVPISGSYNSYPEDIIGVEIDVSVTALNDIASTLDSTTKPPEQASGHEMSDEADHSPDEGSQPAAIPRHAAA